MMTHRVMYVGEIESLREQEGLAWPDREAHIHGSPYEGAWYFEPDDKSLLPPDEEAGGFIVDESELSFDERAS